jgi:hypothetical protein
LRHDERDAVIGANADEGIWTEYFFARGLGFCIDPDRHIEPEQQSTTGGRARYEKGPARNAGRYRFHLIFPGFQ